MSAKPLFFVKFASERKFDFDISDILAKLIYTHILDPSSKRSSFDIVQSYFEKPNFQLHAVYSSLECLSKNSDTFQEWVYKESKRLIKRQDKILFYDCTNYFFEVKKASGLKQYGASKEQRPLPVVQMGLFLDASSLPLAFSINSGNTNEQTTLKPLTKQILNDFKLAKFVVCTDAGLSSLENRQFNSLKDRAFITTQSIKKLK
ncbi:IS1634 family transposase [Amygdalobacter nucleatus]